MTINTLRSLQKRIREATGPDRELDGDIIVAFKGGEIVWKMANYTMDQYPAHRHPSKHHVGGFANEHVPCLTASLDACIALQRAVLPGWKRRVRQGELFLVELRKPDVGWEQAVYDKHDIENHAHLLAIIAARIAELESKEKADV